PGRASQPEKPSPVASVPGQDVWASEIVAIYRTNAAAADERFTHKTVRVMGRMMRIRNEGVIVPDERGKDETRYDLEMSRAERLDGKTGAFLAHEADAILHFHTSGRHRAALAQVRAGQRITMEGIPESFVPGKGGAPDEIHFFGCKLIHIS